MTSCKTYGPKHALLHALLHVIAFWLAPVTIDLYETSLEQ